MIVYKNLEQEARRIEKIFSIFHEQAARKTCDLFVGKNCRLFSQNVFNFTKGSPCFHNKDHRTGLVDGERKECRFYASDKRVFDADWNAAINIARKYTLKQESNKVYHPISFDTPLDGTLNLIGRLLSTSQSSQLFFEANLTFCQK